MHKTLPPAIRVPICALSADQLGAIEAHLLSLDGRDRYLRFGYMASDEQIHRYVSGLRFDRDEVFGVFNRKLELIAMAHLAYGAQADHSRGAEFGVSVSPHVRGRGYGKQLFDRAVMHARNEGVSQMHIHALSENTAMLRIARGAGATVVRDGAESEARLHLPPADFESQMTELLQEQVALSNYQFKAHSQQFARFLALLLGMAGAAGSSRS